METECLPRCSRVPRGFKAWTGGEGNQGLPGPQDCPLCSSAGTLKTTGPLSLYVGQVWITPPP